jgi:hypothetical protein
MPFQVSGQFVTTKSSRLSQVAGCEGAFVLSAGAAFVAMMSPADASVAPTKSSATPDSAVCRGMRAIALPPSFYRSTFQPVVLNFSDQLLP